MQLTTSYSKVIPAELIARYTWLETRNAAAVLQAGNPLAFDDIAQVLTDFHVFDSDILTPGGNRGAIPIRLDAAFAEREWHAVRVNTSVTLMGKRKVKPTDRAFVEQFLNETVESEGYEVDNLKGRVALDVEWNAKDGNLDRDLSAYRALYDFGLIDCAVLITRDHEGVMRIAKQGLGSEDAARRLGTHTTTNMGKLEDRMKRGDSGGCPVLAVGITEATWAGPGVLAPHTELEESLLDLDTP